MSSGLRLVSLQVQLSAGGGLSVLPVGRERYPVHIKHSHIVLQGSLVVRAVWQGGSQLWECWSGWGCGELLGARFDHQCKSMWQSVICKHTQRACCRLLLRALQPRLRPARRWHSMGATLFPASKDCANSGAFALQVCYYCMRATARCSRCAGSSHALLQLHPALPVLGWCCPLPSAKAVLRSMHD